MSIHLAELRQAADQADDDRRALGLVDVLREPGAAAAAWERWEAAHEALTTARREAGMEGRSVSTEIGPQEASVDDVVDAVTGAMQTRYTDPGWRTAWEHVDATGDSHLRSVQREGQQAADREAGR